MKTFIKPFLFVILALNLSCNTEEECPLCFTPPQPLLFELVSKDTNENLFTNGTYQSSQIAIVNADTNENVDYSFLEEDEINLIEINSVGWQTEQLNILVKVADDNIFSLYIDAKRVSDNCCSYTRYDEIRIENTEFELDTEQGIYIIRVE